MIDLHIYPILATSAQHHANDEPTPLRWGGGRRGENEANLATFCMVLNYLDKIKISLLYVFALCTSQLKC